MKINSISHQNFSHPNFKAQLDENFVDHAQRFYLKSGSYKFYDIFMRQCDRFEMYGSEDTRVFYVYAPKDKGKEHKLCLRNDRINKHSGYVLTNSSKYSDILKFFSYKIDDDYILKCEEGLKSI